jgi:hypothetical protein
MSATSLPALTRIRFLICTTTGIEMLGHRLVPHGHKLHEPLETDTHGPAAPAQRDSL